MKSGATIAPKNVVVLPVGYAGGVGVIGAEAQLVGSGTVQVFTNGRGHHRHLGAARQDQAHGARDANDEPIRLTPGQTWVELPDPSYADHRIGGSARRSADRHESARSAARLRCAPARS